MFRHFLIFCQRNNLKILFFKQITHRPLRRRNIFFLWSRLYFDGLNKTENRQRGEEIICPLPCQCPQGTEKRGRPWQNERQIWTLKAASNLATLEDSLQLCHFPFTAINIETCCWKWIEMRISDNENTRLFPFDLIGNNTISFLSDSFLDC